jgi:hypothetical protein
MDDTVAVSIVASGESAIKFRLFWILLGSVCARAEANSNAYGV